MDFKFNTKLAEPYRSYSQKARVLSEAWVLSEIYCPSCGNSIASYNNNKPVADFYCRKCLEDFELKSKKGAVGEKVSGGSYSQMIKRLNSSQKPNFFFMAYLADTWSVSDFFIIPKYFFVPEIIEERKALAESAQRAGWVGSNILFSKIPKIGHVFYVKNGQEIPKKEVLKKWSETIFLKSIKKPETKGWVIDVMNCIDSLDKKEFKLEDLYSFEKDFSTLYPKNKNIRPKIRQQLQFLRDKGYIEFLGDGIYRLL